MPSENADHTGFHRTDVQWRTQLSSEEYRVLRQAGTERPGNGSLLTENRVGNYHCRGCGSWLFDSGTKFDSGCGWPAFFQARSGAVETRTDNSHGMQRVEVRCSQCKSHLGHVFDDAPDQPTGQRYCMNSLAMSFSAAAVSDQPSAADQEDTRSRNHD